MNLFLCQFPNRFVAVLLAGIATGWIAGGRFGKPGAATSPAPGRPSRTDRSLCPSRGMLPTSVILRLAAVRAARTPEERQRATIHLARTLPVSEVETWYKHRWFPDDDHLAAVAGEALRQASATWPADLRRSAERALAVKDLKADFAAGIEDLESHPNGFRLFCAAAKDRDLADRVLEFLPELPPDWLGRLSPWSLVRVHPLDWIRADLAGFGLNPRLVAELRDCAGVELARTDPESALNLLAQGFRTDSMKYMLESSVRALAERDPERARALAARLGDPAEIALAMQTIEEATRQPEPPPSPPPRRNGSHWTEPPTTPGCTTGSSGFPANGPRRRSSMPAMHSRPCPKAEKPEPLRGWLRLWAAATCWNSAATGSHTCSPIPPTTTMRPQKAFLPPRANWPPNGSRKTRSPPAAGSRACRPARRSRGRKRTSSPVGRNTNHPPRRRGCERCRVISRKNSRSSSCRRGKSVEPRSAAPPPFPRVFYKGTDPFSPFHDDPNHLPPAGPIVPPPPGRPHTIQRLVRDPSGDWTDLHPEVILPPASPP